MARTDLLQGTVDPLTLETLVSELQHGSRVSERVRAVARELLQFQQAELYPASQRLGRRGWTCLRWAVSDNNWRAKPYELTQFSRNQFDREPKSRCTLPIAVDSILDMA